jgi:hypothetical protein
MFHFKFLVTILLFNLVKNGESERIRKRSSELFIPKGYSSSHLPPTENDTPVIVKVSLVVLDVRNVDETNEVTIYYSMNLHFVQYLKITQHISIELKLKLSWQDTRLKNETKAGQDFNLLDLNIFNSIWHPDAYFGLLNNKWWN